MRPIVPESSVSAIALLLVAFTFTGCATDSHDDPIEPGGKELVATGGLSQQAPVLTTLPVEYRVVAREDTTPIAGVKVYWSIISGGGSLSVDSSVTDASGHASVLHTLGSAAGTQSVRARAPSLGTSDTTVTFSSNAMTGPGPFSIAQVGIPPNYGIHDTYVRDGLAFVCAWNEGVLIYDVGNGIKGGSPSNPILVSSIKTAGGQTHNAWWFHNPVTNEKKYLFVGEEGPASIPTLATGDIHVVDVSDLTAPVEVATFSIPGAGTHNFWMDEANQTLFAAYYNGGVVAIDVSGTLTGNINSRKIDEIQPGTQPFVWGVQQANGSIYASDMVGGFWQLGFSNGAFSVAGGGNNVPERYTSDLWVHGGFAYTGTWNFRAAQAGNALKVWQLDGNGAPILEDSVITPNISTVSDVEVSESGSLLMFGAEGGANNGFHFYDLSDPAHPAFITKYLVSTGIHTATFSSIGGRLYAFGAKDPGNPQQDNPQLIVLDVTALEP
jgi:hypothetical protein